MHHSGTLLSDQINVSAVCIKRKKLTGMSFQYCRAQIYVHAKKQLDGSAALDKRGLNKGRPRKVSSQDQCTVIRSLRKLCSTDG